MTTNGRGDADGERITLVDVCGYADKERMALFQETLDNNAAYLRVLWRRYDFLRDDLGVVIFDKPLDGVDERGRDLVLSQLRVMKRKDLLAKALECGVSRGVVEAVRHDPNGQFPLLVYVIQFPGARSAKGDVCMLRLPAPSGGRRKPLRRKKRRPR